MGRPTEVRQPKEPRTKGAEKEEEAQASEVAGTSVEAQRQAQQGEVRRRAPHGIAVPPRARWRMTPSAWAAGCKKRRWR